MLFLALTIAAAHTAHTDAAGHLIECSKVEPTQTELRCAALLLLLLLSTALRVGCKL